MIRSNQRRGQAFLAAQNIQREARRMTADTRLTEEEAIAAVFADPELLAKCHRVAKAEEIDPHWKEFE